MSSDCDSPVFEEIARRLGGQLVRHHPLVGGVSARVESIDVAMADGTMQRVVFRQPGAAEWKAPGTDTTRREFDLLVWLHGRGLPVPRPLLLDLACVVFPRPFFVMEYIEGSREIAHLPDALSRMAELLVTVHGLPVHDAPPLPEREDPMAGLNEMLSSAHDDLRLLLIRNAPPFNPRRTMLHGDFWPGNLLWRERNLVGLIDWEDAALGDPLSDVACCRLELRYKYGKEATDEFTAQYAGRTGWDLNGLELWDAFVSAAALAFMGQWGLDPSLEAHMRREAETTLHEAKHALLRGAKP